MDDEESWLYGGGGEEDQAGGGEAQNENPDSGSKDVQENNVDDEDSSAPFGMHGDVDGEAANDDSQEEQPNGDEQQGDGEGEEDSDDDDDSDDDGFKITIDKDKIDEAKTTYQTFGLSKPVRAAPTEKKGKFTVEEFDQIGMINGQLATELDLEGIEDKPWRLPGSDLSDYFNYGFTEETWNAYCQRQRRMRTGESGVGMPSTAGVPMTSHVTGQTATTPAPKIIPSSTFSGGQIPTLGMTSSNGSANRIPTRVPDTTSAPPPVVGLHQPPPVVNSPASIAVMTSDKRIYSNKNVMDFSVPPPGLSGIVPPGPPPTFDAPPPKFEGLPPGLVPPGIPPPPIGDFGVEDPFDFGGGYGGYEPTQESQWSLPPPAESFHPKPISGDVPPGDPSYDDRGDHDVWGRHRSSRDRDNSPRARSYERRAAAADYGDSSSSSRRRRRSRSRSRDRYDRHRERESRERRDRDRERRRTRSRSPRSPSGSERHKHKKSKKDSKREDRRGEKVEIKKEKEDD